MWPPLGCVKCDNSTLTDLAPSFYLFLSLLSNMYCTPTGPADDEKSELLTKYEDGDTMDNYDEVNRGDKHQYDFYALSNMTEKSGQDEGL